MAAKPKPKRKKPVCVGGRFCGMQTSARHRYLAVRFVNPWKAPDVTRHRLEALNEKHGDGHFITEEGDLDSLAALKEQIRDLQEGEPFEFYARRKDGNYQVVPGPVAAS
jgi:hypothetical protein